MSDLNGAAMSREELFHKLAESIAADDALALEGWKDLVLVSHIDDGTPDMTGFCYTEDGRAIPVSPRDFAIIDVIEALRETMVRIDGKTPWHAALFRINRETGEFDSEFEYHHSERWRVTPANVMARAQEFARDA